MTDQAKAKAARIAAGVARLVAERHAADDACRQAEHREADTATEAPGTRP